MWNHLAPGWFLAKAGRVRKPNMDLHPPPPVELVDKPNENATLSSTELQSQTHSEEGSIWKMVGDADGNSIMKLLRKRPEYLFKRDDVGATPLLFLALLKSDRHLLIAKKVILQYQERILDQYSEGPYEGENLLHIAIVNENLEFAKFLVQKAPQLLEQQAVGSFFSLDGGSCPWGAFPLSFAAATNQTDMVDVCLRGGAKVFAEDCDGMTALHIAVVAGFADTYAMLADAADASASLEKLKDIRRSCLHTAVASGQLEIFEMLLDRSKKEM